MKIHVTEDHIRRAKRWNCFFCPVAEAMNDAVPLPDELGWRATDTTVERPTESDHYCSTQSFRLPRSARRFIKNFDETGKGKPFNFIVKGL